MDIDSPAHTPADEKKEDSDKVTFRFCQECSNMLYPREDKINTKLMYACRSCQYSEEAGPKASDNCIYRNELSQQVQETAGNVEDVADDPTLPHSDDECVKCGHRDHVYFQSVQRTAETGMALFYVCTKCSNVWSTTDNNNVSVEESAPSSTKTSPATERHDSVMPDDTSAGPDKDNACISPAKTKAAPKLALSKKKFSPVKQAEARDTLFYSRVASEPLTDPDRGIHTLE